MSGFMFDSLPQRVIFGRPFRKTVMEESRRLGFTRPLVLSSRSHAELAEELAADLKGTPFAGAQMHTPVSATETALALLRESGADGLIAMGGGSAIGLGKALTLRTGLDQIAVPTTYAGSEMTPILGQTENGRKHTIRDEAVRPAVVVYDPVLTLSLPREISVTSGLNAMAHAVEALYAPDRNPVTDQSAGRSINLLVMGLRAVATNPLDVDGRAQMLEGAFLAGYVLGVTRMGIHHKLAHVIGGLFDLDHSAIHAALLPHVVAFKGGPAEAAIDKALDGEAFIDFVRGLGAPVALRDIGMEEAGIEAVMAEMTGADLDRDQLLSLLRSAWNGAH